jgi:energy-coupling factor transport system ATP-binding protein
MFEINNLSFSYKKDLPQILDDISLQLPSRVCVGLTGNNGSGKSTFAYSLVGIIPELYKGFLKGRFMSTGKPENLLKKESRDECAGDDEIDLFSLTLSKRLNLISYTFQDNESQILFGTVADIIGLNESNTDQTFISRIVEVLGIKHLLSRTASELSGGESQKVVLTASCRNNPQLLIYDEATSALDPIVKRDFSAFIELLLETEKTILLLGQSSKNLVNYTSRNYTLSNGKIHPHNETTQPDNFDDAISFWKDLNLVSHEPRDFATSRLVYTRKSSNFVLEITDLKIDKGQNIALLGRNGSGKSTMLDLLGGLLKPTDSVSGLSDFAADSRLVFQSPTSQIITASVEEELSPKDSLSQQQKSLIAEHFPFLDFSRDPLDLSFGQQRILCLLSALLSTRPTLLLDEPELGVDPNNLNYIRAFFQLNRKQRRKTILFATHDLELAANFADVCMMIDEGKVLFAKPPISQLKMEDWFYK